MLVELRIGVIGLVLIVALIPTVTGSNAIWLRLAAAGSTTAVVVDPAAAGPIAK